MNSSFNRAPVPPVSHPSPDLASTPNSSPEHTLKTHISKLENFYASNGNEDFIFGSLSQSGETVFPPDIPNKHDRALNIIQLDPARAARLERDLLESLRTPGQGSETAEKQLFDSLTSSPASRDILSFAISSTSNFQPSTEIIPSSLSSLLAHYPTPADFTSIESAFMNIVKNVGDKKTQDLYKQSMSTFKHAFYGKRQEYSDAISSLHLEASDSIVSPTPPSASPAEAHGASPALSSAEQSAFRRLFSSLGKKAVASTHPKKSPHPQTPSRTVKPPHPASLTPKKSPNITPSPERTRSPEILIKDFGLHQVNKGDFIGDPNRVCEDNFYYNTSKNLFAVFDAAGGEGQNPAFASAIASRALHNYSRPLNVPADLAQYLKSTHSLVTHNTAGCMTTATVCRLLPTPSPDHKQLIYANVGDSRLYLVHKDKKSKQPQLFQLTQDDGEGRFIENGLGHPGFKISDHNTGSVAISSGDRLLLCSDGITGDYAPDFIPNDELTNLISTGSCADASTALCTRATKQDDRTALVIEV